MPLPSVQNFSAPRCAAKAKHSGKRCKNPAAYGMNVCRMHGARKRETVRHGVTHPNYKHGRETREAKTKRSQALADLRSLEALSFALELAVGPRWPGRKPGSVADKN